ncbi:prepilin-type N-terminal cleavage/methylation domain-containing protein [Streptococcus sp. 121]|nr:competence type IV pilus major pilin ComGC [Streptococcus sp. 121]MBJ6745889.1 prepilin-type N-terminal cleavage/methylation domain-containing protein [Streptococcus sp. 121]
MMEKMKNTKLKAFTLIEMLIVILIISVLLLLFVPNLVKQKEVVREKGNAAIVKVVESQAEIYQLNHSGDPNLGQLVAEKHITKEQADAYRDYYKKHSGESRVIPD